MCVLITCEKRKLTEAEFREAFRCNPDGAGFAWFTKSNSTAYLKGFMTADDGWNAYKVLDILPHVVHFRKGTSGGIVPELTHPFIIEKESPLRTEYMGNAPIVFHNGVLKDWKVWLQMLAVMHGDVPDGPMSDTRALAVMAGHLKSLDRFDLLVDGLFDKFVLMHNGKITMYGTFVDDNGISASNNSYKPATYVRYFPSSWDDERKSDIGGIPVGNTYPKGVKRGSTSVKPFMNAKQAEISGTYFPKANKHGSNIDTKSMTTAELCDLADRLNSTAYSALCESAISDKQFRRKLIELIEKS